MYTVATWAPWLLRPMSAKLAHDVRRDPMALSSAFPAPALADKEILAGEDFRQVVSQNVAEAFRQGGRGPAHDYSREARPWAVPLGQIQVPIEIWHGNDDHWVTPQAGGSWPVLYTGLSERTVRTCLALARTCACP